MLSRDYVAALADELTHNGFDVWWDFDLAGGDHFDSSIKNAVETAYVVVVVVTPAGEESEWMKREQFHAEKLRVPVIPLIREGDLWMRLNTLQAIDGTATTLEAPAPDALYGALLKYAPHTLPADLTADVDSTDAATLLRQLPALIELAEQVKNPTGFAAREVLKKLAALPPSRLSNMAKPAYQSLPPLPHESYVRPGSTPRAPRVAAPPGASAAARSDSSASHFRFPIIAAIGALVVIAMAALVVIVTPILNPEKTATPVVSVSGTAAALVVQPSVTPTKPPPTQTPIPSATNVSPTASVTETMTSTPNITSTLTPTPQSTATVEPISSLTPTLTLFPTVTANKQWTPQFKNMIGVTMALVPAGCFKMGADASPYDDERPAAQVCFSRPFWIDKTEVTQAQFNTLGGSSALLSKFDGKERPMENLTWLEASYFCSKRGARLPTEAEWEYSARGPDDLVYPWGNTFFNANAIWAAAHTAEVDAANVRGGASWVGAVDMSGNVWEWTSSLYKPYPYNSDDGRESTSDASTNRVLRGGSWFNTNADALRAAVRRNNPPLFAVGYVGVRCARDFS